MDPLEPSVPVAVEPASRPAMGGLRRTIATLFLASGLLAVGGVAAVSAASPAPAASGAPSTGTPPTGGSTAPAPHSGTPGDCPGM